MPVFIPVWTEDLDLKFALGKLNCHLTSIYFVPGIVPSTEVK